MKRVTQLICSSIIGIAAVSFTSPVHAQEPTCSSIVITNTGAGSNNNGTCVVNTTVSATCTNNVYVLDANAQSAATGAASSHGSTNSGTVISGSATNSNNQTVQIGASCAETTSAAAVPTTQSTPPSATTPAAPSAASPRAGTGAATPTAVAALPYTSANNLPTIIAIALTTIAGLFATSRIAVMAYRHASQK